MTSSVLDGVGDMQSPAPPAFSPLTDPAPDSGNREPSVHDTTMLDHAEGVDRKPTGAASANAAAFHLSESTPTLGQNPNVDVDVAVHDAPILPPLDPNSLSLINPEHILMALASMPNPHQPLLQSLPMPLQQPPSTVHPAQVSMRNALDAMGMSDPSLAPPTVPSAPAATDTPLESFAKIEFADSVFEMTTYVVVIGRDQRAMRQAQKDERRQKEYERKTQEYLTLGLPPPSPPRRDQNKFSKSYVSEEGGMLGPESDGASDRPAKRRKLSGPASASGDGLEQKKLVAADTEQVASGDKNNALNRQYVSHTPGAVPVNLGALMPHPSSEAFIGIHSPGPNIAAKTKGISRRHMQIEYDQKAGVFKAIPLHKNGFFIEDVHHKDHPVVLKSGTHIQIKDVELTFIINGVPLGKTGNEGKTGEPPNNRRYSEGGKEMSFEFENSRDVDRSSTSADEGLAEEANKEDSDSELSELEDEMMEPMDEGDGEEMEQDIAETIERDSDKEQQPLIKPEDMTPEMLAGLSPLPQKRRGPGRPPKNGIMSKREERLRKKAMLELAKKNMPPAPPGEPVVKRKVGRPRKHPLPEDTPDKPEKRKYKPRKKNGEEGGEASDPEKTTKERRREKPKTPPLILDRSDYTEEQLQKPSKNYGILIDEVLTAAPDGLSLKQIYKRIQLKYPFYYFTVDTKGWESSVRHNLIGNVAFKKDDETHLWHRVPGVDIDAGKKRKAHSPDHSTSLHTFGQHYQTPAAPQGQMFHAEAGAQQVYRPGAVPQRPGYPAAHGQVNLGQHPHQHLSTQPIAAGAQQAPQRPAYPTAPQPHGPPQTTGFGEQPAAARQLPPNAQAPAYSSPYASSRPPPAVTATQPAGVPQNAVRQGPPPHAAPSPYNGLPRANSMMPLSGAPAGARPGQQPASTNGIPVSLKPVVSPELATYIAHFKQTTTATLLEKALQGKMHEVDMLVMSVIARGLGLSSESVIPERQSLEDIVLGVFKNTCNLKFKDTGTLHPDLVKDLVSLRTKMTDLLGPRMGSKLNAERLVLSATTRVLGFADKTWMPGSEKYGTSEDVLMDNIKSIVLAHQKTVAGVTFAGKTPTPGPVAHSPAVPTQPVAQAPVRTHLPTTQTMAQPPTQAPVQAPVQAMSQPNPQHEVSAAPSQTTSQASPNQPVPQPGIRSSSATVAPTQSQIQSPAISRLSGPAGLPPKPIVPAPGLAPVSPSVGQNPAPIPNMATSSPKPATASPIPSAARLPSAQGQQYKPVTNATPNTNYPTVTQGSPQPVSRPPSAQGQGQPYAQVPPRNPMQNSNQMTPQVPAPATFAQSQGQPVPQPSVASVPSQPPPQNAARPVTTAGQGQGQVQAQQNSNISQIASTPAATTVATPSQAGSAAKPPMAPVASMATASTAAPAPTPTPTATAAR
ncbi:hypothetical protein QBC43DRAFT_375444 [Cladorrhinum sp. PSN259]|nr:hypothetical protein QBC43DRAFT_375444 [Cladorrhinum sp. PSN259]